MIENINLPGYRLIAAETENEEFMFLKGYSLKGREQVLIKTYKNDVLSDMEIAALVHEFHLTKEMEEDSILKAEELILHLKKPYMVCRYFPCITLREFCSTNNADLTEMLDISAKLAGAILQVHQQHIIHKSVNPGNILLNPIDGKLKITGFGQSTLLKEEHPSLNAASLANLAHLPYISPEQTGRLNRLVDYRSDFYSAGSVFYELFTGELPFKAKEPLELVYEHLAKSVKDPCDSNPDIPPVINSIIMKLLEKMPENRYSSAFGMRADLLRAAENLKSGRQQEVYPLGTDDDSMLFETGRKLYGREIEKREILNVFEEVSRGSSCAVFLPGSPGMGKTALVHEIQKPLIREKGYFVSGKYDMLQRQMPYAPIIAAFRSLVLQVMLESGSRKEKWATKLKEGFTGNYAALFSVIPELGMLMGEQAAEEEPNGADAHQQFLFHIHQLVCLFADEKHPLVLFLDDLQWADIASLELIEYLLLKGMIPHFMLICAYRDNETGPGHPVRMTLAKLGEGEAAIHHIPVRTLSQGEVHEWVGNALRDNGETALELGGLLHRITGGNPLFISQLLLSYFEDGFITSNPEERKWRADMGKIMDRPINDGISGFMEERFQKLPEKAKEILKAASCFGNRFDFKTLSLLFEDRPGWLAESLWMALESGFILPKDPLYKYIHSSGYVDAMPTEYSFLHDTVQQAVYQSMNMEEQNASHLRIGRLLVSMKEDSHARIFQIVHHLNSCSELLEVKERHPLAEWNAAAGELAKDAAAFREALSYFQAALELSGEDWNEKYELTFRIFKGLGECFYLTGKLDEAEKTFSIVLENAKTNYEKLSIYNLQITLFTHMHRVKEAVNSGIEGLKLYGITFAPSIGKRAIVLEFLRARFTLRGKSQEDIISLPVMTDRDKRQILQTLINLNAPSYHADQNLATMLMLKALNYTLNNGLTDLSALVFNNYSLILSAGFNDFKGSYDYGRLAIKLSQHFGATGIKGRVQFVFGSFVSHWRNPISDNLHHLTDSQRYCLDAGNIHLAGANSSFIVITIFMKGSPLEEALDGIRNQIRFVNRIQYPISIGFLTEMEEWVLYLKKEKESHDWTFTPVLDDDSAKIIHYTIRLQMSYLFQRTAYAEELIQKLAPLVSKRLTLVIVPEYHFYHGLWLVRFYEQEKLKKNKASHLVKLKDSISKMKRWAALSPSNFRHKYLLLKAEYRRIAKRDSNLFNIYDESIQEAEKNGFLQDAALANECAGRYFSAQGYSRMASSFFSEAFKGYLLWGAEAKADKLRQETKISLLKEPESGHSIQFDEYALVSAAQSISREVVLENLLSRLLEVTMHYSGADRGILLFKRDDIWTIGKYAGEGERPGRFEPVHGREMLSERAIELAELSREGIILGHACENSLISGDPYVKRMLLKSLLCLPILNKGEVKGIMYLENNQISDAFTKENLRVLELIASQAAISLENADLYERIEARVARRTEELNEANTRLELANKELDRARQAKNTILSDISHDLRSPLAAIKGYIEAVQDGIADSEEQKEEFLRRSVSRLNELNVLIHDLFDLSRMEAGQIRFEMDYLPLGQVLTRIWNQFEFEAERKGLSFVLDLEKTDAEDVPMVEADPARLLQAFSNLISNSIKHTESGGLILSARLAGKGGRVRICLSDTGSGIPDARLPFIFDRNYTQTSKNSRAAGNGIGLSITREIIARHNGKIWAESSEGEGTSIFIELPVYRFSAEMV
ncbi:trifunctional serine/threonine-protein kinase/ATP-binding protein/sensor histidine kinase [Bacillus infantis]|uniref:ATP-binding sensor histidine kinase n=1 Tax=Bacillus infantis TaxID=324767 RepID=UPI001CD3269A|nr:ATP-binding sensor histidine kinase [Bacillus infantis]MCA1038264.1 trifunctional serine/threonine-protein kinase/ATP-binding protein/sensor histidine kinase [Bacillus infantis]